MNWQNLTKRLETEWRRFEGVGVEQSRFDVNEPTLEQFIARETRARPAVDAAIREFVRTKAWPELSADDRYFLQQRLYYGWLLMESLSPAQSGARMFLTNPEDNGDENTFEWLLIEVWPTLGVPMWLEQAQRPNPVGTVSATSL